MYIIAPVLLIFDWFPDFLEKNLDISKFTVKFKIVYFIQNRVLEQSHLFENIISKF